MKNTYLGFRLIILLLASVLLIAACNKKPIAESAVSGVSSFENSLVSIPSEPQVVSESSQTSSNSTSIPTSDIVHSSSEPSSSSPSGTVSTPKPTIASQYGVDHTLKCYFVGGTAIPITKKMFMPCVAYIENGTIKDTMFESFTFLPSPNYLYDYGDQDGGKKALTKADWYQYITNEQFAAGTNMDALEEAVGDTKQSLGKSDYKASVFMSLFYPVSRVTNFGTVDGRTLNFSNVEDRKAAVKWMIDEQIRQFNAKNYKNIKIGGFSWFTECVDYSDEQIPEVIKYTTDYVRSLGYLTIWSVYYQAGGYANWRFLGFDLTGYQPNYFSEQYKDWPNRGTEDRLYKVSDAIKKYGLGVEIELSDVSTDSVTVLKKYYRVGYLTNYMDVFNMYYLGDGPNTIYKLCYSSNSYIRSGYDDTYKFIKKTLTTSGLIIK